MKHFRIIALLFAVRIGLIPAGFSEAQENPSDEYRIIITVNRHQLALYKEDQPVKSYQIATPKKILKSTLGAHYIESIEFDPWWFPADATRKAILKQEGINLPKAIPPNHSLNAMGKVKMRLSCFIYGKKLCFLHGTNKPWLIGQSVSRGCFRMRNEDILELAQFLKIGTPVIIE